MKSGLTSLGIAKLEMVTTEEIMKENTSILDELMSRTRDILENKRNIFEYSLDILMKEEVLSGDQFRCQFRDSVLLPA
ncbi:hypothetical protein D3C71_1781000 [compost metagenome]